MKRFMVYTLIFVMLSSAFTILWAEELSKNASKWYGKVTATDSDGPLSVESYIEVDIDYPGEGRNRLDKLKSRIETTLFGYRIVYDAYTKVKGNAPNDDYEGDWNAFAGVEGDLDGDYEPIQTWDGKVDEDVKSKESTPLDENDTNWDEVDAEDELSLCTSWGGIEGASPEKDVWGWRRVMYVLYSSGSASDVRYVWERVLIEERPALSNEATANAWNYY